ncbi:MAG: hypothetical protein ACFFCI_01265 [Promethearchaeota archaeon]
MLRSVTFTEEVMNWSKHNPSCRLLSTVEGVLKETALLRILDISSGAKIWVA